MKYIKEIYVSMSKNQKIDLIKIQLLIILSVLIETIGVGSIFPVVASISNPDSIESILILQKLFLFSEFSSYETFIAFLGILLVIFLIGSSLLAIFTLKKITTYGALLGADFGTRLFRNYIYQDWQFHVNSNSSELMKKITAESTRLTDGVLIPILQMNSRFLLIIALLSVLSYYNFWLTFILIGSISLIYFFIFSVIKKYADKNGKNISGAYSIRFKLMNEAFNNSKQIILSNNQEVFNEGFDSAGKLLGNSLGMNAAFQQAPKYLVELILLGSLILFLTIFISFNDQPESITALLVLFGFGGLKILPAAQGIYTGFSSYVSNIAAYDSMREDLKLSKNLKIEARPNDRLNIKTLELQDVSFSYDNFDSLIIKDIKLNINSGDRVGIIGETGSGKSTLLDLILGLISPSSGKIILNGELDLSKNIRLWHQEIGYVPQKIYLDDKTIIQNIAYGIEDHKINYEKAVECCEIAQAENFISKLPHGYNTNIGENAAKLSGGQAQRIAIARSLYLNPSILILDEATSAIDIKTESILINSLISSKRIKIIILITHRPESLKYFNKIIHLHEGKLLIN